MVTLHAQKIMLPGIFSPKKPERSQQSMWPSGWAGVSQKIGNNWWTLPEEKAHLANGPWKKSLNIIFPTKYGIPKSSKG